jgi:hypothetical protein
MRKWLLPTLLVIVFGLTCITSAGITVDSVHYPTSNYDRAYTFDAEHNNHRAEYSLYISVPTSLYDYYSSKSHSVNGDLDYAKFVTPDAVKTIAENIRNLTRSEPNSDEEFANNVLAFVHQIPYSISKSKYPVETIADNSGDCDVLSFLAASIMKAGNLDVVLLVYRDLPTSHMNIGVQLPQAPTYEGAEREATSYEYNNKTYWVAECTSGNWKVGYQPELFADITPIIVPIENQKEPSPADVSSNLNSPPIPSTISITLSLETLNTNKGEWPFTISGSVSPLNSGKKVVIYMCGDGHSYQTFQTVTDNLGNYSLAWNVASPGTYYVRTSLIGFSGYAGADSEPIVVFVGSNSPEIEVNANGESGSGIAAVGNASGNIFSSGKTRVFLKDDFTGANVSLSGEFMILKNWQTLANSQQTVTVPERELPITMRRKRIIITIPEHTFTIGNVQESNHFGFILQNNDGNCSASVKMLHDSDVSNIEKQFESNTTFMNASATIKENVWYKAVATMSNDGITTELRSENGTLLETVIAKGNASDIGESGILVTCDPYTVIAFRNLKAESLDQQLNQPVGNISPSANVFELLFTYIMLLVLLVTAGVGITYLKKKNKKKAVNEQNNANAFLTKGDYTT